MGIPTTSLIGPATAQKNGQQVYELILENWANGDGNPLSIPRLVSLIYPARASDEPLPSVTGIAIAPRSDIDRCVVTYNVNPTAAINETFNAGLGGVLTNDQIVSVDRPWYGEMDAGKLNALNLSLPIASENLKSLFVHVDPTQIFTSDYTRSGISGPQTFPLDVPANQPTLRLLLFLNGQAPSPIRRSPTSIAKNLPVSVDDAPSGVFKVMGRRHIKVILQNPGAAGNVIFNIGGVRGTRFSASTFEMIEAPMAGPITLGAGQIMGLEFDTPQIDFMTFYTTTNEGFVIADAID